MIRPLLVAAVSNAKRPEKRRDVQKNGSIYR